ncbi:hypothetical protein [Lysinibacillus sp. NPDC092081]|uniref:hypothetical protein n=1 Tax=Lysinibacillus sp. NPDC092081 TaxID=3364131 RepID=UPI00381D6C87
MRIIERTIILSCAAIFLFIVFKAVYNNIPINSYITKPKNSDYYQIIDKDFNKTVDVPFTDITSFRGNADYIYMSVDQESSSRLDNKIFQYNRKTQKYTSIFNSKFKMPSVQGVELNDNWLVWVDADESGWQLNPYFMNLKTKEIQPLTKENEENVFNDFPVLIGDYAAWIKSDRKVEKAEVMLKNLKTNETESIFDLNTYTFMNMHLSSKDGKILFSDKKNNNGYLYLYDVKSKEIEEIKTNYEYIGWASLLNGQQFIYLTFNDPSESSSDDQKLLFYNISNKHTQEVLSDVLTVNAHYTDFNNQVFFSYNDEGMRKFKVKNNLLVEDRELNGELETLNFYRLSADNNIYIINQDLSDEKRKSKLIIQSELPN